MKEMLCGNYINCEHNYCSGWLGQKVDSSNGEISLVPRSNDKMFVVCDFIDTLNSGETTGCLSEANLKGLVK